MLIMLLYQTVVDLTSNCQRFSVGKWRGDWVRQNAARVQEGLRSMMSWSE
jgi:hypothetical protein